MTLLFRDAEDNALGIISVECAGYDPALRELWVTSDSGVAVSFLDVPEALADSYLRTLSHGFLDISSSRFLGEVDYGG